MYKLAIVLKFHRLVLYSYKISSKCKLKQNQNKIFHSLEKNECHI